MTKEDFLKSNLFKILFPMIVLLSVVIIVKSGYDFGQWLYKFNH